MKPVVLQHVFGTANSGGPVVALDRLNRANVDGEFEFRRMTQLAGAGGVSFSLLSSFRSQIISSRPDLVHIRGLGNEGFHGVLAARLAGVKRILVSVHGTVRDLQFPKNKIRSSFVGNVLEPATLAMATHVMTVCHYAAERDFIKRHSNKFVGVVHNGVAIPKIEPRIKYSIRDKFDIGLGDVVAVCVSRLTREKGYFCLAESLRALPKLGFVFHVWIVGDGPDRAAIESAMPMRNDIVFHFFGHSNDVSSFLAAADFFVFPSLHENLSNALLEAMSYALPVVAFDVGGNSEVVNPESGLLVECMDVQGLARAILHFLNNSSARIECGAQARLRVEANFSIDGMVRNMYSIYRNILKLE